MYYLTALSTIAYGRSIVLVEETGVPGDGMKCTQYYKIHNTEHKTIFIQNTEQI
jgi:hypothetical protein